MNELDKFDKYTGSKEDMRFGFGGDWTDHKVGRGQAIDRRDAHRGTENLEYSRALMSDLEWLIIGKAAKDYVRGDDEGEWGESGTFDDAEFREKGAKYLKGIVERFSPNKKDEFYRHLSNMEDVYKLGGEDRGREKYNKSRETMQGFLQENLISPMEPMEIRRTDDKAFDSMVHGATKNDYNIGE